MNQDERTTERQGLFSLSEEWPSGWLWGCGLAVSLVHLGRSVDLDQSEEGSGR